MIKRLIPLLLIVCMLIPLASCGHGSEKETGKIETDPREESRETDADMSIYPLDEWNMVLSEKEGCSGTGETVWISQKEARNALPKTCQTLRIQIVSYSDAVSDVRAIVDQVEFEQIQFVFSINLDIGSYKSVYASYLLKDKAGNALQIDGKYAMMPFQSLTKNLVTLATSLTKEFGSSGVVIRAPFIPETAFYCEAFKNTWSAYNGTDWVDPNSSPSHLQEALMLCERISKQECLRFRELYLADCPEALVYLSFCPLNREEGRTQYYASALASGLFSGAIAEGSIGSAEKPFTYQGKTVRDAFAYGYISSSVAELNHSVSGLLAVPDTSFKNYGADYIMDICFKTVCGWLIQSGLDDVTIAKDLLKSFVTGTMDASVRFENLYAALSDMQGKKATYHTGTPGIGVYARDLTDAGYDQIASVSLSLLDDAIPVGILSGSSIADPSVLKNYKVIWISDSEAASGKEIQNWVSEGGVLIYAGFDSFAEGKNGIRDLCQTYADTNPVLGSIEMDSDMSPTRASSMVGAEAEGLWISQRYQNLLVSIDDASLTPLMKLGSSNLAVSGAYGKGAVVLTGLSQTVLCMSETAGAFVRGMTQYALNVLKIPYLSGPAVYAEIGDYLIIRAGSRDLTLRGVVMDIGSDSFTVLENETVKASTCRLFKKLQTAQEEDQDEATLLLKDPNVSLANTDMTSILTVSGPEGEEKFIVIDAGKGLNLKSVELLNASPRSVLVSSDPETGLIMMKAEASTTDPTRFQLVWTRDKVSKLSVISRFIAKSFSVQTNESGLDEQWIESNTAAANASLRFCDGAGILVYRFDTSEYLKGTYTFNILQNYIFEISPNGKDWTLLADYSEGGTVPHLQTGNNPYAMVVTPEMYAGFTTLYVRLRNTDTSKGWGGSITSFQIDYYVDSQKGS